MPKGPTTPVLLHAIAQDADCWNFLHLAGAYAHVLPGHGNRPRQPMSLDEMADEVASALDTDMDLIGVALGASVAQHILLRHSSRVRSALLACTSPVSRRDLVLKRADAAEIAGMATIADSTLERWFSPAAVASNHPGVVYAREHLLAMNPKAYADAFRASANHNVLDSLIQIHQPVTLIAGEQDLSSPPADLALMHDRIAGSRFETLTGPHMIHLEEPGPFSAAISRHLAWAQAAT